MQAHFRHLHFNSFPMVWKTLRDIGFWPLQSLSEHSGVHRESNSQHGNSLGSVRVLSLTLFCTLGGMRMWLSGLVLATPLQAFCLGRELKAKVATIFFQIVIWITRCFANIEKCVWPQSNVQTWINHAYWVCQVESNTQHGIHQRPHNLLIKNHLIIFVHFFSSLF